MTTDRFKDGYASAERHWKARWHQANDDLQKAISEIERLQDRVRELEAERADYWADINSEHHKAKSRLAAVADTITNHAREYYDPARRVRAVPVDALRAALETNTTKEK